MGTERQGEMIVVYEVWDPALLPIVKSLLQSAEIPFFVQGEEAMSLFPVGRMIGPFAKRGMAAAVMVPAEHLEAAREALREVEE
ncbi:MAG: DUF2007 domain-containing protein [Thermoanaerobaculia bacterium]|nr:DUF2007 domain-containing protein [Thermoanaerobaculia bacterium]